jgi:dUTP pyrophosphatase
MNEIQTQVEELETLLTTEGISQEMIDETKSTIVMLKNIYGDDLENVNTIEEYKITTKFVNKSNNEDPTYQHEGDSGFDFRANLETSLTIKPLERVLVPTGLYFELPKGYELQIRPRSGMAYKHGITVLNTPGTVDTPYVGEVKVLLINLSNEEYTINHGDRMAQGVISPRVSTEFGELVKIDKIGITTTRGEGGFNSTGKK